MSCFVCLCICVGRTFEEFVAESKSHGWPSFRDEEVVWDNVRCLKDGEVEFLKSHWQLVIQLTD